MRLLTNTSSTCFDKLKNKSAFFVVILVVSILTASAGLLLLKNSPKAEQSLRFVSIIHRHGERAPKGTYPMDPYEAESFWPEGLGALVAQGKVSMHALGRFLRHRYDGFISSAYIPAEISVLTDYVDRTIMSAQLVLAGLYPPVRIQIWNPDLPWQPIPVHTLPPQCDEIFRVRKRCPLLSEEEKRRNAILDLELNKHKDFIANLSKISGAELSSIKSIKFLYDNLLIVEQQKLPPPKWTEQLNQEKLRELAKIDFLELHTSATMLKLQTGVILNEIVSNMKRKIEDPENFKRRLTLYSAHDRNLVRVWRAMNFSQDIKDQPYYGAALIIELHEINNQYLVKILHKKGSLDDDLSVLKMEDCAEVLAGEMGDVMCNFSAFSAVLQPSMISNFEKACELSK
ncbi:prostatic acid phosphatase-like [Bemisia tabaci]